MVVATNCLDAVKTTNASANCSSAVGVVMDEIWKLMRDLSI